MTVVVMGPDGQSVGSAQAQLLATQLNQQAAQIHANAQALTASAGSGFHLQPEAAATLIKACKDSVTDLEGLQRHLVTLHEAPKLGQSPGAAVVAPFTHQVAVDGQGVVPAIKNLMTTLRAMADAYQKASANYQEAEASIARSLK